MIGYGILRNFGIWDVENYLGILENLILDMDISGNYGILLTDSRVQYAGCTETSPALYLL